MESSAPINDDRKRTASTGDGDSEASDGKRRAPLNARTDDTLVQDASDSTAALIDSSNKIGE